MNVGTVTWLTGMTFDGHAGGHHITIDTGPDEGDDRGPSPMDLALLALAACSAMDVVSILQKARQPFTGLVVRAEGERAPEHPRRYTRVTLRFEVAGAGVDRQAVERAVALSEDRYCSVAATFREPAEIVTAIALTGDAPAGGR